MRGLLVSLLLASAAAFVPGAPLPASGAHVLARAATPVAAAPRGAKKGATAAPAKPVKKKAVVAAKKTVRTPHLPARTERRARARPPARRHSRDTNRT